jgi:LCP family protein required for cell wall assembly
MPSNNTLRAFSLIIILSFIFAGCEVPAYVGAENPVSLIDASPNSTPTPTPFMPVGPTPTYIPTAFPTLPPTAEGQDSSDGAGPAGLLNIPEDQINILLLGSDQRSKIGGFRTDTIILLSINPTTKTASMISFPRDLYIYIPGWTYQRINTAMFHGGFELLAETLEYNFGIRPTHYVMTYFWAFEEVINNLGGIDIEVARPLVDNTMKPVFSVPAGIVHMDGSTALRYSRSRYSTSDFDRSRRQQDVIQALLKKLLSLNAIEKSDELYELYDETVTTNLTWSEIASLVPLAVHFSDTSRIRKFFVGPAEVISWTTPGGAQVLLPREEKIIALLKQALENP